MCGLLASSVLCILFVESCVGMFLGSIFFASTFCNDVDSDKLTKDRRLCSQNVNARHHRTYEIHTRARRLVSGPLHATCIVTCPFFFFFFFFKQT